MSGVRASHGENILASMFCLVRYLCVPLSLYQLQWHSRLARRTYKSVQTEKCEGREVDPPLEKFFFCLNVCLVRYLCVPLIFFELQWHSRLARHTYKSVQTEKCEGREFEPPLEQIF